MIGKLLISCVMATVSLYTSDLFPTSVRGVAIGLCSTSGRIGGILAPIIANAVSLFEYIFLNQKIAKKLVFSIGSKN